jgi:hypothetical protein
LLIVGIAYVLKSAKLRAREDIHGKSCVQHLMSIYSRILERVVAHPIMRKLHHFGSVLSLTYDMEIGFSSGLLRNLRSHVEALVQHLISHLLRLLDQMRIVILELMQPGPSDARDGVDSPGAEGCTDSSKGEEHVIAVDKRKIIVT